MIHVLWTHFAAVPDPVCMRMCVVEIFTTPSPFVPPSVHLSVKVPVNIQFRPTLTRISPQEGPEESFVVHFTGDINAWSFPEA